MIWIIKEKNYTVTEYYFQILKSAAEIVCDDVYLVEKIDKHKCTHSSDFVIVGTITKAVSLYLGGFKNIIVWFQGVSPEESYMRNKNILRKKVLEIIEKNVLLKTKMAIFVSQAMKEHYEKKYRIDFTNRNYIMPCFNTELCKESFFKDNKYENNVFAYTGGLSIWQCFEKVLAIYERIEKLGMKNTKLLICTPEIDKAHKLVGKTSIINYEIDYVKVEELHKKLEQAKYGFVIRDDNTVNRVATPTKLSTYLANGLIPIYSECIEDFHMKMIDNKFKVECSATCVDKITSLMKESIDEKKIYKEYSSLFSNYYNKEVHICNISNIFKSMLKNEMGEGNCPYNP